METQQEFEKNEIIEEFNTIIQKYFIKYYTNFNYLLTCTERSIFQEIIHLNSINNRLDNSAIARFACVERSTVIKAVKTLYKLQLINFDRTINNYTIMYLYNMFNNLKTDKLKREFAQEYKLQHLNNNNNEVINNDEVQEVEEIETETLSEEVETVQAVQSLSEEAFEEEHEEKNNINKENMTIEKLKNNVIICCNTISKTRDLQDLKDKENKMIEYLKKYINNFEEDDIKDLVQIISKTILDTKDKIKYNIDVEAA